MASGAMTQSYNVVYRMEDMASLHDLGTLGEFIRRRFFPAPGIEAMAEPRELGAQAMAAMKSMFDGG